MNPVGSGEMTVERAGDRMQSLQCGQFSESHQFRSQLAVAQISGLEVILRVLGSHQGPGFRWDGVKPDTRDTSMPYQILP